MNWEHDDLRKIHDKLVDIHQQEGDLLAAVSAILLAWGEQTKLLTSIDTTLKSIDAKTPDVPPEITADDESISTSQKG